MSFDVKSVDPGEKEAGFEATEVRGLKTQSHDWNNRGWPRHADQCDRNDD